MSVLSIEDLKDLVSLTIAANEEGLITAEVLEGVLQNIIDSLEDISGGGGSPSSGSGDRVCIALNTVTGQIYTSISDYVGKYFVGAIIATLKSGSASSIQAGYSIGGTEVLMPTDLTGLSANTPIRIGSGVIPKTGNDTVHIVFDNSAVYDLVLILERYSD